MSEPPSSLVLFRRVPAGIRPIVLERFARKLCDEVAGGRRFECLITSDRELRGLNRQFRGQDYATDVLSFPVSGDAQFLGSLAISTGRARAQAKAYGHPVEQEMRVLMLHGLLHLLGMDHETDRGRMARTEARWRLRLKLPDGLIERAGR
jgi:probable rRNA maturation factor